MFWFVLARAMQATETVPDEYPIICCHPYLLLLLFYHTRTVLILSDCRFAILKLSLGAIINSNVLFLSALFYVGFRRCSSFSGGISIFGHCNLINM